MNLKQFFENEGYNIDVKEKFESYINIWESWYIGKVAKFHNYWIYNRPRT